MLALEPQPDWPESWQLSHRYDELELHGSRRHLGYTYAYGARKRHILDLVRRAAPAGGRVLDVAAAQGNFSIALANLGYTVTWNDIRTDLIEFVKRKHDGPPIDFRAGNIFEVEGLEPFDVALVAEVIEHVAHPDAFLAKIALLVRPGGYIVLTTPNGRYFRNPLPHFSDCADFTKFEESQFRPDADGHIFLLHPEEIDTIAVAAGLHVVELRDFGNPLTCGYLKSERLLQALPRSIVDAIECGTEHLPKAFSTRLNTGLAVLLQRV